MQRVMIIGGSGSGKSTLARMLGAVTGLPVIHIDPMYYTAGWIQRPPEVTRQMVLRAAARDSWIFEGNNSSTFAERIARADTFVFLDLPTYLRVWRVMARIISNYGRTRPDSAESCPERFDRDFMFNWVVKYNSHGRPKALNALASVPSEISTFHLKSRADVRKFLTEMVTRYE